MRRRDRTEMVAAVMSAANNRTVTDIARLSNLNWRAACEICTELERKRLISKSRTKEFIRDGEMVDGDLRDRYALTESGKALLETIKSVISLF